MKTMHNLDSVEKNCLLINQAYTATWISELTQLLTSLQERCNIKHFHLLEEAKNTHTKNHEKI